MGNGNQSSQATKGRVEERTIVSSAAHQLPLDLHRQERPASLPPAVVRHQYINTPPQPINMTNTTHLLRRLIPHILIAKLLLIVFLTAVIARSFQFSFPALLRLRRRSNTLALALALALALDFDLLV